MISRSDAIKEIKTALKRRSGKSWSIRGGRGTAYGWIEISSPPKRRIEHGHMSPEDRIELTKLLDLKTVVHEQGEDIPASSNYRQEYIDRANGITPTVIGKPYWD